MTPQTGKAPAKYQQIATDLRARIEAGEYPVTSQMPTKDELMTSYGAALATVDSALRVLRKQGMIESRQGAGTFVLAQHPAEREADQLSETVAELKRRTEGFAELEQAVSRLESNLMDLYAKLGVTDPRRGEASSKRQDKAVGNG